MARVRPLKVGDKAERARARAKAWYKANKARAHASMRAYAQTPQNKAYQKSYGQRPERRRSARARSDTPARKESRREYDKSPERRSKSLVNSAKRRPSKERGLLPPDPEFLKTLLLEKLCHYCGVLLLHVSTSSRFPFAHTVDHKLPLCRGGDNDSSNLVAACSRCNARKGKKDWLEYIVRMQDDARAGLWIDSGLWGNGYD